jgi:hypothetical protein
LVVKQIIRAFRGKTVEKLARFHHIVNRKLTTKGSCALSFELFGEAEVGQLYVAFVVE